MATNEADPTESRGADDISPNTRSSPTEALESNSDPPPAPRIADDDGADGDNDHETGLDAEVQHVAPAPPAQSITLPLPEDTTGDDSGVPIATPISDEDVQAEEVKEFHLRFLGDVALATAENDEMGDVEQGGDRTPLQVPITGVDHAAPSPAAGTYRIRHIAYGIILVAIGIAGGAGIVLGIRKLKYNDGENHLKGASDAQADKWEQFDVNTTAVNEQTPPTPSPLPAALSEKQSLLDGLLDP